MANTSTNTVQAGQNWSTIAQNAGLTPQQFLALNPQAGGSDNTYKGLNNVVGVGTQYYLPTSTSVVSNENAIGNANNIINKQGTYQSGPTTSVDANGNTTTTHADGSAYTPTTPPQPVVQGQGGYYNNVYYAPGSPMPTDANGNVVTLNDKPANYIDWNAMKAQFDATGVQQLANIEATYNNLIQQQQQANAGAEANVKNALFQGGITGQGSSSQYAPISSQGIVTSQVNYGLQQIADLNTKKQAAILAAQNAIQQGDFQYAQQAQAQADKIAAQQQAAMDKINNDLLDAKKQQAEQTKQIEKENTIADLYNKGFVDTSTIIAKLKAQGNNTITAKEVSDTLALISGIGGSGTIGEYNIYRAQTIQKGLVPMSYIDFKDQQESKQAKAKANQAYSTAYASAAGRAAALGVPLGTSGGTISNDNFAATIDLVANMEPTVAGKKAVKAQLQNLIANGDYATAYSQITNSVENSLTGESKKKFADARTDYQVMGGLRDAVQAYADAGGNMGLLKGSAEEISRKLGQVTDPKLTKIAVELQREFQTYRNQMTGAAFGVNESKDYASVNPTASKNLNLNLAIIDGARNQLKNRIETTINSRVPSAKYILDYSNMSEINPKNLINNFIKNNPQQANIIAKMYEIPGATDQDIYDYLKANNLIK